MSKRKKYKEGAFKKKMKNERGPSSYGTIHIVFDLFVFFCFHAREADEMGLARRVVASRLDNEDSVITKTKEKKVEKEEAL